MLRTTALVLSLIVAFRVLWIAHALVIVVFLGMLFGIAVSAGTDRLQRWRIPRGVGAPLIVLGFFGMLAGFGAWMAPTLRDQGAELRQKLPEAVDRMEEWIDRRQGGVLGSILGAAPAPAVTAPPRVAAGRIASVAPDTGGKLSVALHDRLRHRMGGASRYLFPFLTHTVELVGGLVLMVFLSIYFAIHPALYRRGALSLLPPRARERGALAMDRVATVLRRWLVTQLIAMIVMAVASTAMLLLFHVKAAFALGLLAGLFEFIPTVGPVLSALPGVAMGFLDSPEKAAGLAVAYWALQFTESHVLIPVLMKQGIHLPPALTVVTQALFAIVFGFLGLMVAVPVLATVTVLVRTLYLEPMHERSAAPSHTHDPDLDEDLGDALPASP